MQHNRPKIAEELGGGAKPKEVADEGTRRWGTLPESQKEVWYFAFCPPLLFFGFRSDDLDLEKTLRR
jgi:hypothetical protein